MRNSYEMNQEPCTVASLTATVNCLYLFIPLKHRWHKQCYNTLLLDVQSLIQSICLFISTKQTKEMLPWKGTSALSGFSWAWSPTQSTTWSSSADVSMEWHLEDLNTAGAVHFLLKERATFTCIREPSTSSVHPKRWGVKICIRPESHTESTYMNSTNRNATTTATIYNISRVSPGLCPIPMCVVVWSQS